ncbi:MAG: radical SAM protein [Candidatus Azobacteroides sp.]|nr:radical SAM protein [Candidatus Azobacteroides sp.]
MDNDIDYTKKYMMNPAYTIIPDQTRAIITTAKGFDIYKPSISENTGISWRLNPIYAVIFSFFDGSLKLSDTIKQISVETGFSEDRIIDFIKPFFYNTELLSIKYMLGEDGDTSKWFVIPKQFIIENTKDTPRTDLHSKEEFYIRKELWNFDTFRLSHPIHLTLMLNNKCVTNCVYCYANKDHKVENPLSTEKILSLIKEANDLGVLTLDISGGEVMLHKDWDVIVSELLKYGFLPYISTKVPLTEEQIKRLKELGIQRIQVSIDAWNAATLSKVLQLKESYFDKLKETLRLLEVYDIKVSVKSVITKFNKDLKGVEILLTNLVNFSNIVSISVAPGESSLYKHGKTGFTSYCTSIEEWNKISKFVSTFATNYAIRIYSQGCITKDLVFNPVEAKAIAFGKRSLCSGNTVSLYILPDGQVTICEELYWSPKFILGDITKQSIMEIWNSEKAIGLNNLSQNDFRPQSACKYCPDFSICHSTLGVCWKFIYLAYGTDHWDLPDPRCPLAPPPVHEFYR